jgi:carbonic anhydrase/acetyltransferase-like protein (isoleucine patch superfamily)
LKREIRLLDSPNGVLLKVVGQNYRLIEKNQKRNSIMGIRIHPTAEVSDKAEIGEGSSVWHQAQVREA